MLTLFLDMVHRPLDIRTGIASIGKNPTTKELSLERGDIQRVAEEYGDGRGEGTVSRFGTPTQDITANRAGRSAN